MTAADGFVRVAIREEWDNCVCGWFAMYDLVVAVRQLESECVKRSSQVSCGPQRTARRRPTSPTHRPTPGTARAPSGVYLRKPENLVSLENTAFMGSFLATSCKKGHPKLYASMKELASARWLSQELLTLYETNKDTPSSFLGSEDTSACGINKIMSRNEIEELRTRSAAFNDPQFKIMRSAEWSMLQRTTPALKKAAGGRMRAE